MSQSRRDPPVPSGLEDSVRAAGILADDLRRRLYLFVRDCGRPVTRDEAAAHVGISGRLAAFHLDKLAGRGLLEVHYARKPGRSGPGAGRTSKYYSAAASELLLSLPHRSYELAAEILASAVASARARPAAEVVLEQARLRGVEEGRSLASAAGVRGRRPPGRAEGALAALGYEPRAGDGSLVLRNCPFHRLATREPELICGMNLAFVEGLLEGLGVGREVAAELAPVPGLCCVRLRAR